MDSSRIDGLGRREFLAAAGVSLGIVGAGALTRRAVHAADDPYGGFRMGLQTYSLRAFSLHEALAKTRELGLQYVELFPGHLDHLKATFMHVADERVHMAKAGIVPDAYGVVPFTTNEDSARRIFEFARFLGLRSISADPKPNAFDLLDTLCEEYQIPIAIHNHGPNHIWGKPKVIFDAVKDHHPLIGVCADTGHFLRAGVDPIEACQILSGRVFGLHVKDFVSEDEEVIAGEGKLDLKGLFAELRKQKFDGVCSVEYELTPEDPMAGMKKGLKNVREAIASLG